MREVLAGLWSFTRGNTLGVYGFSSFALVSFLLGVFRYCCFFTHVLFLQLYLQCC